jgi:hemerythrin-like domain-containing protein
MCSYCGCEAEPLIQSLTDDHAAIADLAYRIDQHLDRQDRTQAKAALGELARRFWSHSRAEETGLFSELAAAGEASRELNRLLDDHRRLRPQLADPALLDQPDRLRQVLAKLSNHAETEDDDLFPFALQVLPASSWNRINESVPSKSLQHS